MIIMRINKTPLEGFLIIEPDYFQDQRGFFLETYQEHRYVNVGINDKFVQDNHSRSSKGVLRGMHFQKEKPQGKLVRVVSGEVHDVAVDLRKGSCTFGQFASVVLSAENKLQFWVPPGFAHGFVVLSDIADFEYKCTDYYDPSDEGIMLWNDSDVKVPWPIDNPSLSEKDANAKKLIDLSL